MAEKYNLKIRINIVIFHCFIIILVTSRKRFIVVKMTFNLKRTNETGFTYDMHVMHVYLNNICFFFVLRQIFHPTTSNRHSHKNFHNVSWVENSSNCLNRDLNFYMLYKVYIINLHVILRINNLFENELLCKFKAYYFFFLDQIITELKVLFFRQKSCFIP